MSRSSRRRTARGNTDYLRKLLENTGLDEFDLFEEEEDELAADEGGDEMEMDLEDEGGEGEVDVDSAQAAIEDLGAALGLDVVVEPEGEEEGEEEDLEDEGDEEEIEFESQLYGEADEEDDDEEVVEIDESTLRNELRRLKRRRQGRNIREETSGVDEPSQTADAFGGGDVEDEIFVDVDEATLLNALADELGDAPKPSVGTGGETDVMIVEGRRRRRNTRARQAKTNRFNESRKNRALTNKLGEYKKAVGSLRGQLTEMNLFNAKLLYANKLMQNRNLSPKQQRAIVEALDGAKTLREAKLLYKSLTNSLGRTGSRALKESAVRRTSGSSSRSTRSARPAQNGVEVDRWAVLAGIPGKDSK